jgi:Homeodomain
MARPIRVFCTYCPACTATGRPCGRHAEIFSGPPRNHTEFRHDNHRGHTASCATEAHRCEAGRLKMTEHITLYPASPGVVMSNVGNPGDAAISGPPANPNPNPSPKCGERQLTPPTYRACGTRRRWTTEELAVLEEMFGHDPYPSTIERKLVACRLRVTPRTVQIWLQNARARIRREQSAAGAARSP